jgi:hypothetical protein
MTFKIAICGAGQLGSRYLQGLSFVEIPLEIWVYDISSSSIEISKQRYEECDRNNHIVNYIQEIQKLPSQLDLVIVSTSSNVRIEVVKQIFKKSIVEFWVLEKILAQSISELDEFSELFKSQSNKVWVNTPMHIWPLYENIKNENNNCSKIFAEFRGYSGLASNSIHYIDLISRWNNTTLTHVETSNLEKMWIPSKRDGFFEVNGELILNFEDGSKLILDNFESKIGYCVTIIMNDIVWTVFEEDGFATNNLGVTVHGKILLQSEMTSQVIFDILINGTCKLPNLETSISQHKPLINAYLRHWNENMTIKTNKIPIT